MGVALAFQDARFRGVPFDTRESRDDPSFFFSRRGELNLMSSHLFFCLPVSLQREREASALPPSNFVQKPRAEPPPPPQNVKNPGLAAPTVDLSHDVSSMSEYCEKVLQAFCSLPLS